MDDSWKQYYRKKIREQREAYEAKLNEAEMRYQASMLIVTKQNDWLSEQLKSAETKIRFQTWKIIELEKENDGLQRQLRNVEKLGGGSADTQDCKGDVPNQTV